MTGVVLCIASGPSLTAADVALARARVDATVCVSDTHELAPGAEYLFAADLRWWRYYHAAVSRTFTGRKLTSKRTVADEIGIEWTDTGGGNSGEGGLLFALSLRPRRVYLLGYDMKRGQNGEKHFFGDHPPHMPATSPATFPVWVSRMHALAAAVKALGGPEIINWTRDTALECFPREPL